MNGQFSRTNEDWTWNQQSTVTCQTDFMAHVLILLIIDAQPFRHCQVARPSCSKLFLPGGVCKMRHVSNVQDAWQIFIPRPSDVAMGDWKHHPAATVKDSDPRSSNSHKKTWFEPLWGAPRCQHWLENRPKSPESFSWNERQTIDRPFPLRLKASQSQLIQLQDNSAKTLISGNRGLEILWTIYSLELDGYPLARFKS